MGSSKRSPRGRRKQVCMIIRGRKFPRQLRNSTERKLEQLQMMVPPAAAAACPEINMETLFERTADYIFLLEAKLCLLRELSTFYGV